MFRFSKCKEFNRMKLWPGSKLSFKLKNSDDFISAEGEFKITDLPNSNADLALVATDNAASRVGDGLTESEKLEHEIHFQSHIFETASNGQAILLDAFHGSGGSEVELRDDQSQLGSDDLIRAERLEV